MRMDHGRGQLSAESYRIKEVTWEIPNFLNLPVERGFYVESPEFPFASGTWCLRVLPNGDEVSNSQGDIDDDVASHSEGDIDDDEASDSEGDIDDDEASDSEGDIDDDEASDSEGDIDDDEATEDDEGYDRTDCIGIRLLRLRSDVPKHWIFFRFGIFYPEEEGYYSEQLQGYIEGVDDVNGVTLLMRSEVVEATDRLSQEEVTLTVFCEIHVRDVAGVETASQTEPSQFGAGAASFQGELSGSSAREEEEVQEGPPGVRKLQLHYKTLLQSGEDSDVVLAVSGKEFRAHRCILRARSAVFSAMFKHETRERESGKVVIDDLDPDSFPDFLNHLYTGRVEAFSDENAFGLYSAADKYDAQELKSECREYMQRTLSVDTFCDVISLALRYREKELLTLATDFFSKNLDKIIVTPKWLMFMRDNYVEANELFVKAFVSGGK